MAQSVPSSGVASAAHARSAAARAAAHTLMLKCPFIGAELLLCVSCDTVSCELGNVVLSSKQTSGVYQGMQLENTECRTADVISLECHEPQKCSEFIYFPQQRNSKAHLKMSEEPDFHMALSRRDTPSLCLRIAGCRAAPTS